MIPTIILGVLLMAAAIMFFTMNAPAGDKQRKNYLEDMAYFFETEVEPVDGHEDSFRIGFKYHDYECSYEDIAVPAHKTKEHLGYIKIRTSAKLSLSFTERERTRIRANVQSLEDMTKSMWGNDGQQVKLPKSMQDFQVFTNNVDAANRFLSDEKVLKILSKYQNRESRGRPLMSVEIKEGIIILEFHERGGLKPSIIDLRQNITTAEQYLQDLILLADALKTVEK